MRAARMALEDAGGRAGGLPVRFVPLNGGTRSVGDWDPAATFANARRAVRDDSTIGYIGELNSGASAISMPVLNEGGIAQVSPLNTYVGLTRRHLRSLDDEPWKYFPAGVRTYARVIPADHVQARALATWARELGARRVALVDDGELYSRSLAFMTRRALRGRGISVARRLSFGAPPRVAPVVRALRRVRADALVYTGLAYGAARLWRGVARPHPRWALMGSEAILEPWFARRIPLRARSSTYITTPVLHAAHQPPDGQAFLERFRRRYGTEPAPEAIYGYEAMALLLDAIDRSIAPTDRAAVVEALFATRNRDSVLGRYSIDAFGDTTLSV